MSENKLSAGFKGLFFGLICLISSLQATDRIIPEEDEGTKFGLSIDGFNGSGIQNYMSALWLKKLEELLL